MSGCIFIIVWKRSSNSSNFSDLPSKVSVVVLTGRTMRVCVDGFVFIPIITSASLLMGSTGGSVMPSVVLVRIGCCAGRVVSSVSSLSSFC